MWCKGGLAERVFVSESACVCGRKGELQIMHYQTEIVNTGMRTAARLHVKDVSQVTISAKATVVNATDGVKHTI
jgi:hypothetical protein